jgi:hypothetical protein
MRPARLYCSFSHYLINCSISEKKNLFNTKRVFWCYLQTLSETLLILRTERDIIKYVHWSSCEVPILLSDFNEYWIFKTNFSSVYSLSIILKKEDNVITLDLFLERGKWGLFTLLPEAGNKSGRWTVVLNFCMCNARDRVIPYTNKSHRNVPNELLP